MYQDYAKIGEWIKALTGLEYATQARLLYTLLIILVLLFIKSTVSRLFWRQTEDPEKRYRIGKIIGQSFMFFTAFAVLWLWVDISGSLINMFALISAALTISLQDMIKTLAGWVYILARKPFVVGDRVQIGGFSGDVIDISPVQFTLNEIGNWVGGDQSTGRVIHLPNNMVLNQPVINYTEEFSFIWSELPVVLTFDSNWQSAKEMVQQIVNELGANTAEDAAKGVREASKKYMLLYRKLTPIVYTTVKPERGIILTARFLVEPRQRRDMEQAVWERVLTELAKHEDIKLIR